MSKMRWILTLMLFVLLGCGDSVQFTEEKPPTMRKLKIHPMLGGGYSWSLSPVEGSSTIYEGGPYASPASAAIAGTRYARKHDLELLP